MKRMHKNTVKSIIRKQGSWAGYISPSNVNSYHITGGWHIGMSMEVSSLDELETVSRNYAWYNCNSELGNRVVYWVD